VEEVIPRKLVSGTPLRGIAWDWGSVQALRGVAVGTLQFHPGTHCIVQWPLATGCEMCANWKEQGTEGALAQLSGYACAHMWWVIDVCVAVSACGGLVWYPSLFADCVRTSTKWQVALWLG